MIEVYVDESGTHKGAKWVVVAAWSGTADEWRAFEAEWAECLSAKGIAVFHAKEPTCDPLHFPLIATISKRKLSGIAVWVDPDDYNEVASSRLKTVFGSAYAFCAVHAVTGLLQKGGGSEPATVVIEDGHPSASHLKTVLHNSSISEALNIKSVTIAKKKDFSPLQVADFLAHCVSTENHASGALLTAIPSALCTAMRWTRDGIAFANSTVEDFAKKARHEKQRHLSYRKAIDQLTAEFAAKHPQRFVGVIYCPDHLYKKYPRSSVKWGVFDCSNGRKVTVPLNAEGQEYLTWFNANIDHRGRVIQKRTGRRAKRREKRQKRS